MHCVSRSRPKVTDNDLNWGATEEVQDGGYFFSHAYLLVGWFVSRITQLNTFPQS